MMNIVEVKNFNIFAGAMKKWLRRRVPRGNTAERSGNDGEAYGGKCEDNKIGVFATVVQCQLHEADKKLQDEMRKGSKMDGEMIHPKAHGSKKTCSDNRSHQNEDTTDKEEGWKKAGRNKKKLAIHASRHQIGQEEDEIMCEGTEEAKKTDEGETANQVRPQVDDMEPESRNGRQ